MKGFPSAFSLPLFHQNPHEFMDRRLLQALPVKTESHEPLHPVSRQSGIEVCPALPEQKR
jgi:hypothetical protein